MNLDDMGCIGCVDQIVLSSTIGRNKNLIPGEVIRTLIDATQAFAARLEQYGIHIHLAGGETADVGDIVRTIDVGYTAFARMRRSEVLVNDIRKGDVVVGLASFGQASYETSYNGGMGSNGLTSARHDVLRHEYAAAYPDSYDPNTPEEVIYVGSRRLTDQVTIDGNPIDVGRLILSPTRTYLPVIRTLLDSMRDRLHGLIHCTGGGQTKVIKFMDNKRVVKNNLFPLPPLFQLIQEESGADWKEMYQVFNMGHRLEVYVPENAAEAVIAAATGFGIGARVVGYVEEAEGASVRLDTPYGTFDYVN